MAKCHSDGTDKATFVFVTLVIFRGMRMPSGSLSRKVFVEIVTDLNRGGVVSGIP